MTTGSMVGVLGGECSEQATGVDVVGEVPATKCDVAWFERSVAMAQLGSARLQKSRLIA